MKASRFVRFVFAGGVAAMANFFSRIALSDYMPYVPSIVTAYLIGMTTAFVLNRLLVFREPSNALRSQMFWFTAVNLAAVLQTVLLSLLFARIIFPQFHFTFHPETVAHAIGVIVPVFSSYLGHKHLSFRAHKLPPV